MGLLGSSLGILSAMMAANPEAAAAAAVFSGIASIIGVTTAPKGPTEIDYTPKLDRMVLDAFSETRNHLDRLMETIAGAADTHQNELPIEMQTQSFDNPIINVFGDGKWLQANPGKKVEDTYDVFFHHFVSSPLR
jgi:hypothetical protein